MNKSVILFDGVCNLCNSFVRFVIRRDRKNRFVFASLQSAEAERLLTGYSESGNLKTIILVEGPKIYVRSDAVLRILRHLSGGWQILYGLVILPRFIRDGVYRLIAKKRYRWFGKREECMVPGPEIMNKFLEYESQQKDTSVKLIIL